MAANICLRSELTVLELVGKKSKTEEAVESIEAMVAGKGLASGDKLPSQRNLSELLGFSRPTVREALIAMETRGRLVIEPGKGVFLVDKGTTVLLPSTGSARSDHPDLAGRESQMYQFRYAIEPAVAGLVAVNATAAQIEDMTHIVQEMRAAMAENCLSRFAQLDFAFHAHMLEAANNRFFTEAITPFLNMFFESQKLPLVAGDELLETIAEHEVLMEYIRTRDSRAAREAMEQHVKGVARRAGVRLVA